MGNWIGLSKEPPPAVVLVPPLFDFPPLSARSRMLESPFKLLFAKLALKCLFEDYFEEAAHFTTKIILKPFDDPHVDLIATVSGPLNPDPQNNICRNALFRWQSDVDDPHTFMDFFVSNSDPILQMRSSAFYPKYGIGAFGRFPVLLKAKRRSAEDYGSMGFRYGSGKFSIGAILRPFALENQMPCSAWLISKVGKLTVGVQYEPANGSKGPTKYMDLSNWSAAIGYETGSGSPLSPSFNCSLELAKNNQFIASFYQHAVVQRRVKNPFEENKIVGITNYIDFGFEFQARVDDDQVRKSPTDSSFQIATSWQANKNFLLKGKLGPLGSSLALAFKSWWNPSFTFNVTANRSHVSGETKCGFGFRVENLREASYQRADPKFLMLTPSKGHLAEGMVWKAGGIPMLKSDLDAGNFEKFPREMRPLHKIL